MQPRLTIRMGTVVSHRMNDKKKNLVNAGVAILILVYLQARDFGIISVDKLVISE